MPLDIHPIMQISKRTVAKWSACGNQRLHVHDVLLYRRESPSSMRMVWQRRNDWKSRRRRVFMLLCKKIKLEVSTQDAATLEFMQGKCRGLYNWWVMKLRAGERWHFKNAKKTLKESRKFDPEINAVYGKLLAEVFFRLDKAMQAFFQRVAEGEQKPGFPRVKPRHQFFTLCYPAMYLTVQGHTLILPTGGKGGNK